MSHSVRSHLGVEIDAYDAAIRRFIPGYEEMLAVAAREVARCRPGLVLDLGGGTGALAEAILSACAGCTVQLIDIDQEMLARARSRLARFSARARFSAMSFFDALPPCDVAAASLALHHVPAMAAKRALYRQIHEAVAAGGAFINADAAVTADPAGREATYREWVRHMGAHGISEKQAYGHLENWAAEDTYFPLREELAAVEAAGFRAECIWKAGPIKIVVGTKQA